MPGMSLRFNKGDGCLRASMRPNETQDHRLRELRVTS